MCYYVCMISDGEIVELAQELLRRRVLTGQANGENDMMNAISQTTLLALYGRQPTIDDLKFNKNYLDFITKDEMGQTVRVIATNDDRPFYVWSNQLDVDCYVFLRYYATDKSAIPYGWIPRLDLEDTPITWWEKNGKKISYYHTIANIEGFSYEAIASAGLLPMPDTFHLVGPVCDHSATAWNGSVEGWSCLKCDRMLYDSTALEILRDYGKCNIGRGSEVAAF